MKKTTIALVCAAIAFLTGASVWEGSAVAAPSGELPEFGYYVATNSFPRNTVVDVMNLETEKTVRAIVVGPLDSPGLLASLSPAAVAAIGLDRRSVGRVRVTMPADPIAFSRFTDGLVESRDPDRNPRAAAPLPARAPAAAVQPAAPAAPAAAVQPEAPAAPAAGPSAPEASPAAALAVESEAPAGIEAETASPPQIAAEPVVEKSIDVPDDYVPPPPAAVAESRRPETSDLSSLPDSAAEAPLLAEPALPIDETPEPPLAEGRLVPDAVAPALAAADAEAALGEEEPELALEAQPDAPTEPEIAEAAPEAVGPSVAEVPEIELSQPEAEIAEEEDSGDEDAGLAELTEAEEPELELAEAEAETAAGVELAEAESEAAETEAGVELAEAEPASEEPASAPPPIPEPGTVALELLPAEERPPHVAESDIVIEPTVEPLIDALAAVPAPAENKEAELDPALFLAPLPHTVPTAPAAPPVPSVAASPPQPAAAAASVEPRPEAKPSAVQVQPKIAAPVVAALEKGKYYVQLGAYNDPAAVNEAVAKLGGIFPATVQEVAGAGRSVYRVFVGPVNQGESGALLLRFKRRGYPDAFIKSGG